MTSYYLKMKRLFAHREQSEIVLLSLSALAVICVSPFIVVRLLNEDWAVAILNSVISVVMLSFFIFVYKTRKINVARFSMSIFIMGVIFVDIAIKGPSMFYWFYPCTVAIFYLVSYKTAFFITCLSAAFIIGSIAQRVTVIELSTISITSIILICFSFLIFRSNHKIAKRLTELAAVDALTLVGNRHAFDKQIANIIRKFERDNVPVCLIIFDLDYFKSVNDTYGHSVGDEVLRNLATLITQHTRAFENLYRYGGEEFVILPVYSDLEKASVLAENIRQLVESHRFEFEPELTLTVSLGIAQYRAGEQRHQWFVRADEALYQAKKSGRNKFVCAER